MCVCVCGCGVKTAIDRVKGFSSGCFWRRPRWHDTTPHEWRAGSSDTEWSCAGLSASPRDRQVYSSFLLAPGILAWILDRGNSLLIPYAQWISYSRLGPACWNHMLVLRSSFLRKFTEADLGYQDLPEGCWSGPKRETDLACVNPLHASLVTFSMNFYIYLYDQDDVTWPLGLYL